MLQTDADHYLQLRYHRSVKCDQVLALTTLLWLEPSVARHALQAKSGPSADSTTKQVLHESIRCADFMPSPRAFNQSQKH